MKKVKKDLLEKGAVAAIKAILDARDRAENTLAHIVKECGGFIPTIAKDAPEIYAFMDYNEGGFNPEVTPERIFGLRYVEGEGLFILTDSCLSNYEYDKDCTFDFVYSDEIGDEDMAHLNDALSDITYFISFNETFIIKSQTVISILSSIAHYL